MVAAHLIAERTGSTQLLTSANSAYVHGMGVVLLVSGVAALAAALLAGALLPNTPTHTGAEPKPATPSTSPAPTPTPGTTAETAGEMVAETAVEMAGEVTSDMATDLATDRPDGRQ